CGYKIENITLLPKGSTRCADISKQVHLSQKTVDVCVQFFVHPKRMNINAPECNSGAFNSSMVSKNDLISWTIMRRNFFF
ncbi:MAG: hypothetical protein ACI9LN_003222, partial [Saprospiraceae bacterium]